MVKPGKEQHWEAARGLAALLVMFHHSVAAFYHEAVFGVADDISGSPLTRLFTMTPLGVVLAAHFAVCFFFVLSGYVLSLKFFGEGAKGRWDAVEAAVKRPFRLAGIAILSMALSWGLTQMSAH
ncbi:MAG: acyltransferase family protein, partial [Verrucomicrobiales bacterium]|nr:acyltransferase family protein [Verrucomicrobiales bacterium]